MNTPAIFSVFIISVLKSSPVDLRKTFKKCEKFTDRDGRTNGRRTSDQKSSFEPVQGELKNWKAYQIWHSEEFSNLYFLQENVQCTSYYQSIENKLKKIINMSVWRFLEDDLARISLLTGSCGGNWGLGLIKYYRKVQK